MHPQSAPPHSGRSRRTLTLALLVVPLVATPFLVGVASPDVVPSAAAIPDDSKLVEPTNAPPESAPLELDELATVTLITGDEVTMHPGGLIEAEPGPGREHIVFDEQHLGDQISVVPSDAAQLLAEGKLDERLFDITYLVREGYDDTHRDDMPLIVEGEPEPVRDVASGPGTKIERESRQLKMSTVARDKAKDKGQLWTRIADQKDTPASLPAGVDKIWLDGMAHLTLDESVPQIGAPEVWDTGYTGKGVTVAVLDTGIDTTHPDLTGQVVAEQVFAENPAGLGVFTTEQVDFPIQYRAMAAAAPVPTAGRSDPLVHVGRACVDSEGDQLLADPAGKTALVIRDQSACPFAEKYDAAVDAGATAVVFYNDVPGLPGGTVAGAEHEGEVWAAGVTDTAGTALRDLIAEPVTLTFTDRYPGDVRGHGTHVAATIAGTGDASDGARKGVAPDATILNGKVLADNGNGQESWIIAGMEWAASNGADVVNMSLSGCCADGTDPMSQAVNALTEEHDTLFVIAAGNNGNFGTGFVGTPGTADAALTVGAVDKNDQLASFSSRGPRMGDQTVKPEVVAPGVGIVAARAASTSLGAPVDNDYTSASGTSMATPHVAGAAALLAQAYSDLDALALRDALTSTTVDKDYLWFEQGTGRIDTSRAVGQGVYAQASVNFGIVGGDANSAERQVTYTNHTDRVVTLQLDTELTDMLERSVDVLELSKTRLVVRPGSEATITATVDPHATDVKGGIYGGVITASGRDVSLRTAVGFGVKRDVVPLHHDWDEDWRKAYKFDGPGTNLALKGAALGPDGKQMFLFGAEGGSDDSPRLILLSVDTATGEEIWAAEQPVTYASLGPAPGIAVASDGSKVFVTQNVFDPERSQVDIVTAAYNNTPPQRSSDPPLGEQLWQVSHAGTPFPNSEPGGVRRIAVTPDSETVIVLGTEIEPQCPPPISSCDSAILTVAYDTDSGDQRWVARHSGPSGTFGWAGDLAISPTGELAYVSGVVSLEQQPQDQRGVTIAYDIRGEASGEARWLTYDDSHTPNANSMHTTVSDDGRRVFVASAVRVTTTPPDEQLEMKAYDAVTGELSWSTRFSGSDHGFIAGHTEASRDWKGAVAVSPNNDLVFVTGQHCEGGLCTGAYALVTMAYDQATGEQHWSQIHESAGIPIRIGRGSPHGVTAAISPDGSQLYVAGACCWAADSVEANDQVTLAYDAPTGKQLGVARYRFEEAGRNEGLQVLVNPDGSDIYTVSEIWPIGGRDYWGLSAYSPPISLSVTTRRSRGAWSADLKWTASGEAEVNIYRDDELIATVENAGGYTDELGRIRQGQTFDYQVCATSSARCSEKATAVIRARPLEWGSTESN